MKYSSIYVLIAAGILLQGCANTINPQGHGTRALLEGSKQLSMSSKDCPRGIGLVRMYKDTLDGNKTRFNAKLAYTSKAIEGEFNVYNLLDENNAALLQKGERAQAKAEIDSANNSIIIKLSDVAIESGEGVADSTKKYLVVKDEGVTTKVNKEISIRYNPKAKYYENWGEVENGALSEVDTGEMDKKILRSISAKIGGGFKDFPIPETIDNPTLNLDQKVDGKIGTPLEIKLNPKTYDTAGIIYVQFTNGAKGKDNATYNYITDDVKDAESVKVPTTGMKPGEYIMNIFRSEIFPVDVDDKAEGPQSFCMEVGTGVMGRASIAAAEEKK